MPASARAPRPSDVRLRATSIDTSNAPSRRSGSPAGQSTKCTDAVSSPSKSSEYSRSLRNGQKWREQQRDALEYLEQCGPGRRVNPTAAPLDQCARNDDDCSERTSSTDRQRALPARRCLRAARNRRGPNVTDTVTLSRRDRIHPIHRGRSWGAGIPVSFGSNLLSEA